MEELRRYVEPLEPPTQSGWMELRNYVRDLAHHVDPSLGLNDFVLPDRQKLEAALRLARASTQQTRNVADALAQAHAVTATLDAKVQALEQQLDVERKRSAHFERTAE